MESEVSVQYSYNVYSLINISCDTMNMHNLTTGPISENKTMQEQVSLQCPTCLHLLKNQKSFQQHKSRCQITICEEGDQPDLEVRGEPELTRLLGALYQSKPTYRQHLKFCEVTGIAVPGIAPLFFSSKHCPPILNQIGCASKSYHFLKEASLEGPVHLKKTLKVKLRNTILQITHNTLPSSATELKRRGLKLVDKRDHVVIYHTSDKSQVSVILQLKIYIFSIL